MKHPTHTIGAMTSTPRPQSNAVAAGTAAGLRHLERVYVAKVNAAIADDNDDLARELADDAQAAVAERVDRISADSSRTLVTC